MAISRVAALLIIVLGIGLRCLNLDNKPYWMDEAFTSLRVSGYRPSEIRAEAFTGRELRVSDLHKYQHVNPDRGVLDTALSLAASDPQHPPLYFVLARIWAGIIGDSGASLRAMSVLLGICMIPAVYWVCLELFRSPLAGWIAMILVAVSPFQFVYSQEARPYVLLGLMTLVTSAAMLSAARQHKQGLWWLYAFTVVLALYTHLSFLTVLLAQTIYMLIVSWRGAGRNTWIVLRNFVLAVTTAFLAFLPWLIVIIVRFQQLHSSTGWTREDLEMIDLIKAWSRVVASVFIDIQYDPEAPWSYPVRIPALLLVGLGVYFLCRKPVTRSHMFVLLLLACTAIPLIIPDLLVGGRRSSIPRYWVPALIALQLAVAHLLAVQIVSSRWKRIGKVATGGVAVAGLISCAIIVQADMWWNKGTGGHDRELARTINQVQQPLLIASSSPAINVGHILSLVHLLDKNVRIHLIDKSRSPLLPEPLVDVFILNPSTKLRLALEQPPRKRTLIQLTNLLWQLQETKTITKRDG